MQQIYKSFKGTAREFIAAKVQINGKVLDQPSISMMAQYGVLKKVGIVPRPEKKKGHAEIVYQATGKSGFKVEFDAVESAQQETTIA